MDTMKTISIEALSAAQGGVTCAGIWLGTKDSQWGVCIGVGTN
jgi:hypothetical protein